MAEAGVGWAPSHRHDYDRARHPALLHRFLGIGMLVLSATFGVLRYFEIGPVLPEGPGLVRARLPVVGDRGGARDDRGAGREAPCARRPAGQPVEQYWATPAVGMRVVNVWFLLEGAGTLPPIGYYLTGQRVAGAATALLLMVFWTCGPNAFAKA